MATWHNASPPPREVGRSMRLGFRCKCPNCGQGKLFRSFLKATPSCEVCNENMSVHRADDMPPYVTIMIVGHIIVPANLLFERGAEWSMMTHMIIWPLLTILLTMAFIQPVKGALIAYQWALRLHGFDPNGDPHDVPMKADLPQKAGS